MERNKMSIITSNDDQAGFAREFYAHFQRDFSQILQKQEFRDYISSVLAKYFELKQKQQSFLQKISEKSSSPTAI